MGERWALTKMKQMGTGDGEMEAGEEGEGRRNPTGKEEPRKEKRKGQKAEGGLGESRWGEDGWEPGRLGGHGCGSERKGSRRERGVHPHPGSPHPRLHRLGAWPGLPRKSTGRQFLFWSWVLVPTLCKMSSGLDTTSLGLHVFTQGWESSLPREACVYKTPTEGQHLFCFIYFSFGSTRQLVES